MYNRDINIKEILLKIEVIITISTVQIIVMSENMKQSKKKILYTYFKYSKNH